MIVLRDLWRKRLSHLLSGMRNDDPTHRELANAQSLIEQDYKKRFAVELVQNANDQMIRYWKRNPERPREAGCVRIVWRDGILGVFNQGLPFEAGGVKAVASLAVSDKLDEDLVGNKGVGFKAIYQVCEEPEIYSAPDRTGAPGCRFTLPREWAAHQSHLEELLVLAKDVLREEASETSLGAVRKELLRSSASRYPRDLPVEMFWRRMDQLGVDATGYATAVVLPLRDGTGPLVAESLEKIHASAACLLFLPGVSRIEIDIATAQRREVIVLARTEPRGASLLDITTTRSIDGEECERTEWWMLQGEVTGLSDAAAALGIESWEGIDRAPISVALPQPDVQGRPIGAGGRVCMGLPTDQPTGLPIWIDGRFHGFLNRDRISIESQYNQLVFEGVVKLCGELLTCLRAGPLPWRRAATLAFERGVGILDEAAFSTSGGFGRGAIVLSMDGDSWRAPQDCWLPGSADASNPEFFSLLADHHPGPEQLPDAGLLGYARDVLAGLGVDEVPREKWLCRVEGDEFSPLEHIARDLAGDDERWPAFLAWMVAAWKEAPEAVSHQRFLPVVGGARLAPADGITIPRPRDAGALPDRVSARIRFLDDRALDLRGLGRALTPLAKQLTQVEWVEQPRVDVLLDVLAMALVELIADPDSNDEEALELWGVGMEWLADPNIDSARAKKLDLRVPVCGAAGTNWLPVQRSYLGTGWADLEREHEARLERAYCHQRLISWVEVQRRWQKAERERWVQALAVFGVGVVPRSRTFTLEQAPLDCYWRKLVRVAGSGFPEPVLEAPWRAYLDWLVENVDTHWSHSRAHFVDPVVWLDGMERAEAIQPIAELALLHHSDLPSRTCLVYGADSRYEGRRAPSFWVHFLGRHALFPSRGQLLPAAELWNIPVSEESRYWTERVRGIDRTFAGSTELLRDLGVHTLESAPADRLISALHQLAHQLAEDPGVGRTRGCQSLAIVLYEQLADRSRAPDIVLGALGAAPIPVEGRGVVPVDFSAGHAFLLIRDDDQKAMLVEGEHYDLPYPRRSPPQHFVDQLVAALGKSRIKRASQVLVESGFVATTAPVPVLGWLKESEPTVDIELHLAAILTFALPRRTQEIPSSAFTDSLTKARIRFGHFDGTELVAYFDRDRNELCVDASDPANAVRELWRVVGRAYIDVLGGYSSSLRRDPRAFVLDRCEIGPADLTDIEERLGRMGLQEHADVFVVARSRVMGESITAAAGAWRPVTETRLLLEWIGIRDAPDWLMVLRERGCPEGVLHVLQSLGADVTSWQEARRALGREPYLFPATLRAWVEQRSAAVAAVRLACARDVEVDLDEAGTRLKELAVAGCPEALATTPDAGDLGPALRDRVTLIGLPPPSKYAGADHYRDAGESERSRLADRWVELRLDEACAASPAQDRTTVERDPRLQALRRGPWAHWRVALYRLGVLLKEAGWPAYDEMQRANAFIVPPKEPPAPPEKQPEPTEPSPPAGPVDLPPPNPPRNPPPPPPRPKDGGGGGGGGGGHPGTRATQQIGDRGEKFFYQLLQAIYAEKGRELDPGVWVSDARRRASGLPKGDDDLGYDFRVRDIDGRIAGCADALLWVEVKTTTGTERRFPMSEPEWARAEACAAGTSEATYVIVRIYDGQAHGLRVTDVVVDPVQQQAEHQLRKDAKDHWITLGEPQAESTEEQ